MTTGTSSSFFAIAAILPSSHPRLRRYPRRFHLGHHRRHAPLPARRSNRERGRGAQDANERTSARAARHCSHAQRGLEHFLALLGCHHVDTTWHSGHLLAPTFRALRLCCLMLGDGLGTLERLPAFPATIIVGWHGPTPANAVGRKDFAAAADRRRLSQNPGGEGKLQSAGC